MADSSSRASSPEPGEAAPRGRIVQLKASARSSNSLDRQSLEASRASPAYNSHPSAWRGSPPRSRVPRPYAGAGRGYFKRPQLSYDQPAPYARERVFSRSRGRSVSRSPSRASQRSRSPSPRSPKSPQQRSRSRSRSFSPRGHRTFSNWERGGRAAAAVQYAAGRGGRGAGGFDGRPRGRERDSWSRGGGRGGGRYATYRGGGGSRFYPKEVRYKPAEEVRYKPAAPMPPRRSMSRDRGSNEGGASYRDRQRDYREYEPAYRARREMSHRSLVRTASFSSEYYRDSEPSASAEEGEEKPEEFHERSGGSHTPSEAGSTDRDMTSATDSNWKRASLAAALPPRSMAGDSYVSYRKGASSPNARPYDEDRPPVFKRENTASVRIMRDDTRQSARSSPPSEPVEERELKRSTGHRTPFADANDTPKEQVPAEPTGRYMSPEEIAADGESKRFSPTPTAAAVKSEEAHDVPEQTTDVTKSSDYRQEQTARAIKSGDGAEKAAFKDGETLKDANDDIEMDKTEIQQNLAVKSPDALVKTEDEVPMHKEGGSSVDQRIDQRTPSSYQTKQNESCKEVVLDPAMSPHGGNEEMETKAHAEHVRGDDNSQKGSTQDNDVDMDAVSSQKVVDANDLSSARRTAALSAEVKNVDARDDKDSRQEASQIEKVALSQQPPHESSTLSAKAEEVKPTDAISSLVPEDTEVEEGEMPDSGKEDLKTADSNVFKPQEVSAALSHTVSSVPSEERNEADVAKVSTAPERGNGRERRARLERSRTDPSTDAYKDNGKPRSTSFSSFGVPNGTRREEGSSREMKAFSQAKSELTLARGKEHGVHRNQHDPPSSVDQPSSQHGDRSVLDRRASFSTLSERGHYSSSEARGVVGFTESADGSKTARASSSFSNKSSPPKPYGTFGNNVDGRRRGLHDELKREDAAKRELLRAGSMDSMFSKRSRTQEVRETAASASNSPSRRAIGGTRPREELPTSPREELPTLPEIPLPPSGATPENSSPGVMGEGTPTKRLRPRLGWGQGLVASSPPQPAKRPRIGWGQGLILQTTRKKENTSGAVSESAASVGAIIASPTKAGEATVENSYDGSSVVKSEPSKIEPVIEIRSEKEMPVAEERILATSTPEKERQPTPVAVESSSVTAADDEAGTNEDTKVEDSVEMEQDAVAPAKPSKEEILSTIDILDSDIAGVKKQMKSLQRTIASAEVKQVASSVTDMEVDSADELDPSAVTSKQCSDVKSSLSSPTDASNLAYDQTMLTSPVKVAVDSRFVELLAGVFSENLRKTTAANEQLPKRIEQGQLATKIYHQPSDYAFYQANIDRGSALSDRVRMKVRKRNCARHEYMKKLARDYVDLKKSWKTGVKRMEKDRKRQDKLRLKQLQKQKLKSLSESGPIRTTNTNHQSPHVQVLVAAEKAAEAAGGEGVVRTSSRLTNNSSADLENNDLEKIEQAKAQALIDQEVRKKRLKNALSTVIPDMLITPAERQQRYFTRFVNGQSCMADGLVADWKQKEKAEMKVNPWNDLEKCIYMDKFLQFPKNFPRISSFLRNKTTGDVIAFYYRTKKVADYKVFLREQQLRRRGAGSKNTWSCWNLAACAAICLGVQFPEHVGKLLLHPSNFRSHQASDNILNSAGAQRILRTSSAKAESGSTATKSTGTVEGVSALEMISGSDHTPTVRPSMSEVGVQIDDFVSSGDSDTSDEEKFNLYTQQLEKFVAGQQRPFLVDYAALLSDNSYSTGYEVSTLSIEERLKKYPTPSKELESTVAAAMLNNPSNAAQDSKGKQQGSVVGSNGNLKIGGPHLTKKELKQQRKMKKMHEGTGSAAASPTSNLALLQPGGNAIGERTGNHGRKKSSVGSSSTPGAMPGARNTPRISIPGDEKAAQSGKKTSRGAGTPGTRRNSHHPQTSSANASPMPSVMSGTSASTVSIAAPLGGAAKKGAGTPNATARSATSSAAVSGSSAAAPAKRVVQKWTDGEKADFLKYFSQYGKDWATLTDNIPTKTAAQIKNYYQNYKNRLNLQDILKRRIENAAASGGAKGAAHSTTALASTAASGNMVTSPRSAAAGLMSGTLRQMGRPVDLPGSLSVGMPSGSMAMSASDNNLSFQAALNAAQPGLHGVNVLSELSANQFGMQSHPDQQQQQQSRDMMNTNPERYLKLLNMQHQLQIMQFQQQQKPQGVGSESAGAGSNNSPYHEGQMNAGLYQFSRQQQQQHSVPPQHMSLQALQQMGLQGHSQAPAHSQMVQHSMQQQQPRGSFAEMGHPSGMYQSMNPMQTQHPQALTSAAQMGMSPTNSQQYDRQVDTSVNAAADGRIGATRDSAGSSSSVMRHDASQRVMMNMGMMNNAAGGNGSAMAQAAPSGSPHQPPLPPSRSMAMETGRPPKVDSRQSAWRSSPVSSAAGVPTTCSVSMKPENPTASSAPPKGREALAPPVPPPIQPVRSRMSFSSILNESESPREDATPRGNGSMVIRQQESPRVSQQQREDEQQLQRDQQQQLQQRQPAQLHLEHARAMPPTSAAELARSPVSAPSPTAHLLPRRSSVPTPHNRMGLMSSLLNVPSPERRTATAGHQSPLMHQQQQMQRQVQSGRYYETTSSSAGNGTTPSRSSVVTMVSGMPTSSTMSSAMSRSSPSEKMASAANMGNYTGTSSQMAVALSRSGSGSSTSSAVSAGMVATGDSRGQQLQQQQMWNYAPQMGYEEAEILKRRAQIAEEEAARAKAAAAQALQEAQKARQQALDMAANMARYNSAMQHQQSQQHQTQQHQSQHQQQAQQQQFQQYQQQLQAQQAQQMQQQHDYHQQHQAQQLHQQHMQQQALHHHLQLIQHQQQQQQRTSMPPSDMQQQQMNQQQQPPREQR